MSSSNSNGEGSSKGPSTPCEIEAAVGHDAWMRTVCNPDTTDNTLNTLPPIPEDPYTTASVQTVTHPEKGWTITSAELATGRFKDPLRSLSSGHNGEGSDTKSTIDRFEWHGKRLKRYDPKTEKFADVTSTELKTIGDLNAELKAAGVLFGPEHVSKSLSPRAKWTTLFLHNVAEYVKEHRSSICKEPYTGNAPGDAHGDFVCIISAIYTTDDQGRSRGEGRLQIIPWATYKGDLALGHSLSSRPKEADLTVEEILSDRKKKARRNELMRKFRNSSKGSAGPSAGGHGGRDVNC